jgi:hypothetical protein
VNVLDADLELLGERQGHARTPIAAGPAGKYARS